MNAEQTKAFAGANGFAVGRNGKRVTATHLVTGKVLERGGYDALYNAMFDLLDRYKRGLFDVIAQQYETEQKTVDEVFNSFPENVKNRVRAQAAVIRQRARPTHTVGIWFGERDCEFFDAFSRHEAVKIVRRWLSGPDHKRVWRAEIYA